MGAIKESTKSLYEADFGAWAFEQPAERAHHGRSWRATIDVQRIDLGKHLADNPPLKPYVPEAMAHAWQVSRITAASEGGLPGEAFPEQCPYSWDDAMSTGWMPQ